MIEENETQETSLQDLIDLVERDDLPTNEFSIQDTDPMVILGKLNEVIAYLQTLQNTINASDSKANEALQKAIQAVADATQALSVANGIDDKATQALANAVEAVSTANSALSASNTALNTANTAISTANTALSSANNAVETAENALGTASRAENKADTAITTANGAKGTAEGIDAKATNALTNSQTAVSTANSANATAQEALDQVVAGLGTKVYRDSQLLSTLDIKPIEDNIADNATAINNEATTRANAINALDNAKVDKVAGKQLSTEDFTTAEKNKLAGLNNYDDTQIQADITALQERATNIETKNTEQDTAINARALQTSLDNTNANVNNLSNTKADKATIPTKTSQLTNDSEFLSGHIYNHIIKGGHNLGFYFTASVIITSSAPFTFSTFCAWLKNNGFDDSGTSIENNNKRYPCSGAGSQDYVVMLSSSNGTSLRGYYGSWAQTLIEITSAQQFSDTVLTII